MKPWYKSKTIWGALTALIAEIIKSAFGVDLTDTVGPISDYTLATVQVIGLIISIIGRFHATEQIAKPSLGKATSLLVVALSAMLLVRCAFAAAAEPVLTALDEAWTVYHAVQSINDGQSKTEMQILQATAAARPSAASAEYGDLALDAARAVAPVTQTGAAPPVVQARVTTALTDTLPLEGQ